MSNFFGNAGLATAQANANIDESGRVLDCKVIRVTGAAIDPCQPFPVGKTIILPVIVNGKATPAAITVATMINSQPDDPRSDQIGQWFSDDIGVASATAEFEVDPAGKVTSCVVKRVTSVAIDPCRQFPMGKTVTLPFIRDGKPEMARLRSFTFINTQSRKPTHIRPEVAVPTPHNP